MPDLVPALPPGYRARPATADDIGAIHRLVAACECELYRRVQSDLGSIAAVLARPGLIPQLDTLLIHDQAGQLAARAWVNRRSEVDVHPQHRGRGLGTLLLNWAEARARQAGSEPIIQIVPDNDTDAVTLLLPRIRPDGDRMGAGVRHGRGAGGARSSCGYYGETVPLRRRA
ncbi:GNAT family N-acetyltransferase [Streptomyces qaidamensis]|uniref:GNAT family N-acetyltransferase n=1 Tax=Streptomyces qaidamensis TaxID=1783515 RepID=UPI00364BEBA2